MPDHNTDTPQREATNGLLRIAEQYRGIVAAGDIKGVLEWHVRVVNAAVSLSQAPQDASTEEAIGAVLLGRLRQACAGLDVEEWAQRVTRFVPDGQDEAEFAAARSWLDEARPVVDLVFEIRTRNQDRNVERQTEALRRAATQAPNASLTITEVELDGTVRDRGTYYGPDRGATDSAGVTRTPADTSRLLGTADDRVQAVQTAVWADLGEQVNQQEKIQPHESLATVSAIVAERALALAKADVEFVGVIGGPPPSWHCQPGHLASVRSNAMLMMSGALLPGNALASRAERGDPEAKAMASQVVARLSLLRRASPTSSQRRPWSKSPTSSLTGPSPCQNQWYSCSTNTHSW